MLKSIIGVSALILLAAEAPQAAQTFYITADGHAANDGLTWETAWTFLHASTAIQEGDTLIVRKGDYPNWNSVFDCDVSNITVKGEDQFDPPSINRTSGGWAIIRGSNVTIENMGCQGTPGICISLVDTNHVTLQGITADGNFRGIEVRNSDDNIIEDSILTNNREGIYIRAGSDRNLVRGNTVSGNGHGTVGDRCGICIGETGPKRENIIDGNTVTDNGGYESDNAIVAYDAPRTIVINNSVKDNYRGGIMITQYSTDSVVENNLIVRNGLTACYSETNISALTVRNASSGTVVANNRVKRNCVAAGNRWGQTDPRGAIDVRGWGDERGTDNVTILNNQVYATINGPDYYIDPTSTINSLIIYPEP